MMEWAHVVHLSDGHTQNVRVSALREPNQKPFCPNTNRDYTIGCKYLFSSNSWSEDPTKFLLYKVYICRLAETKELLKQSLKNKRPLYPKLLKAESDGPISDTPLEDTSEKNEVLKKKKKSSSKKDLKKEVLNRHLGTFIKEYDEMAQDEPNEASPGTSRGASSVISDAKDCSTNKNFIPNSEMPSEFFVEWVGSTAKDCSTTTFTTNSVGSSTTDASSHRIEDFTIIATEEDSTTNAICKLLDELKSQISNFEKRMDERLTKIEQTLAGNAIQVSAAEFLEEEKVSFRNGYKISKVALRLMKKTNDINEWTGALLRGVFGEDAHLYRCRPRSEGLKKFPSAFLLACKLYYREFLIKTGWKGAALEKKVHTMGSLFGDRATDMSGRRGRYTSGKRKYDEMAMENDESSSRQLFELDPFTGELKKRKTVSLNPYNGEFESESDENSGSDLLH